MPRILRIINRFNLGGPTYNVAYLTKFLSPEFETLLVGGSKDETEDSSEFILENLGLKPVIIPEMKREISIRQDRIAYKKIKALIREFKPDIVHTHASKAGALGRRAAYACHVPVIVHTFHGHVFHSYFGKLKTALYLNIERRLARKTDAIIAISEKQKQELSETFRIAPAEKFHVIPLGFDLERFRTGTEAKRKAFREKYQVADDEIAIGIIGRLVPIKNHRLFLDAFLKAKGMTSKKIKGFIIGDGELKTELMEYCKTAGLSFTSRTGLHPSADIFFTSWIKDADVAIAGLDIVALSSLNEGTPVSLIEAQASGRPVVSTRVGGVENIVLPDRSALLSDPGDAEEFARHLLRLVEDEALRGSFGNCGSEQIGERFSYTRLTSEMGALYRRLLQSKA
ncbi:MAG TPA: glycosyltransferase [Bacteroidia bacterium]|nr:glycosyltransferase [Bacteroidia bacterium]